MGVTIHRAVLSTRSRLLEEGPSVLQAPYKGLPRLQAQPAEEDKSGPHFEGRALDIVLLSDRDSECAIADLLIECFLKYREEIEWEALIYNREQWNAAGGRSARILTSAVKNPGRDYEHRTHIHIQWPNHKKQLDYSYPVALALAEGEW